MRPAHCRTWTRCVRKQACKAFEPWQLSMALTNIMSAHTLHTRCPGCCTQAIMASWCLQVLFVEAGWGCDQHGQNVTVRSLLSVTWCHQAIALLKWPASSTQKAAVRACRNAIEFNSLPAVRKVVPGGYDNLRLHVKLGSPRPVSASFKYKMQTVLQQPYSGLLPNVLIGDLCRPVKTGLPRSVLTSRHRMCCVAACNSAIVQLCDLCVCVAGLEQQHALTDL